MNDPQQAYTAFYNELNTIYDSCFPVRNFKPGYKNRKPWLSEELKKGIVVKNKMFKKLKKKKRSRFEEYI